MKKQTNSVSTGRSAGLFSTVTLKCTRVFQFCRYVLCDSGRIHATEILFNPDWSCMTAGKLVLQSVWSTFHIDAKNLGSPVDDRVHRKKYFPPQAHAWLWGRCYAIICANPLAFSSIYHIIIAKNIHYLLWNRGFWRLLNITYTIFLTPYIQCTNLLCDSCG